MGLIIGSGSFTRFFVDGALPEDYLEEFPKRISRYAFRNLDETSDQERTQGWVNVTDMFDNRFLTKEFLMEPCIAMSWRVDVRKVPSKALIQYSREAEEKIKAMEEVEYLPKKRRREIKEEVRVTLLKRAIPRARTYDMIWNLRTGVIYFGSTSNRVCDDFAEFFLQCFGMHLKSVFPYSIATEILEKLGMEPTLLDGIVPSINAEVD